MKEWLEGREDERERVCVGGGGWKAVELDGGPVKT